MDRWLELMMENFQKHMLKNVSHVSFQFGNVWIKSFHTHLNEFKHMFTGQLAIIYLLRAVIYNIG